MLNPRSSASLRARILDRIGAMGDMPIPIKNSELARVIMDAGAVEYGRHLLDGYDEIRDVDAPALEALLILAAMNSPHPDAEVKLAEAEASRVRRSINRNQRKGHRRG